MQDATFHEGEVAVQQRMGVRERLAEVGSQVIRDHMPQQHRTFFAQLPFMVAGTVDALGQPWASVLAAPPGFISSPDPRELQVRALPLPHDPLRRTLAAGQPIGLLGIEPHTRRRNRMNGVVGPVDAGGFSVRVGQSFGNCPKYIQAREPVYIDAPAGPGATAAVLHESAGLDAAARRLIEQADTFFIATAHPGVAGEADAAVAAQGREVSQGVDVSHRGGRPGFVHIDGDGALTVPDYVGNFFFNTLGNLAVNPRCGLLFIDFETGGLLYLAARASIVWEGAEIQAFPGAQRLLRLRVQAMRRVEAALPLRWSPAQLSPVLP